MKCSFCHSIKGGGPDSHKKRKNNCCVNVLDQCKNEDILAPKVLPHFSYVSAFGFFLCAMCNAFVAAGKYGDQTTDGICDIKEI